MQPIPLYARLNCASSLFAATIMISTWIILTWRIFILHDAGTFTTSSGGSSVCYSLIQQTTNFDCWGNDIVHANIASATECAQYCLSSTGNNVNYPYGFGYQYEGNYCLCKSSGIQNGGSVNNFNCYTYELSSGALIPGPPCSPGYIYNIQTIGCSACPAGTYQPAAYASCLPCPTGMQLSGITMTFTVKLT